MVLFWNAAQPEPKLSDEFAAVYSRVETGLPFTPYSGGKAVDGYGRFLNAAAEGLAAAGGFGAPERLRFDWQVTVTRDAWLAQVPTSGGHQRLPAAVLEALLTGMGAAIDAHGGTFGMEYATVALVAARTP